MLGFMTATALLLGAVPAQAQQAHEIKIKEAGKGACLAVVRRIDQVQFKVTDAFSVSLEGRNLLDEFYFSTYGRPDMLADNGFETWGRSYLLGATGATMIGLVAWRWSRKDEPTIAPASAPAAGDDRKLTERLDDELRDLA